MDNNLTIVEMFPSAEDYNRLRTAVGWRPYDESVIESSLPHSIYCVCALIGSQTVGMARIIGDAGMVYYIQDVIVLPEYQRRGIGTQMMDSIMSYLRAHSHRSTILGLMAAVSKEPFYERYGFTRRPTEKLGAGMTLFWQGD